MKKKPNIKIHLHKDDLPSGIDFGNIVAVDTETMGLNHQRDRLCVLQISGGDGEAHLVQFSKDNYDSPNLKKILEDSDTLKIMHFARFDMATIKKYLEVMPLPIYCTKIASKLARTYSDKHGLKELCNELLNQEISKQMQSSDWGTDELSQQQQHYAAQDVLYLHKIKDKLNEMLKREGRLELIKACFEFLPYRVDLDLAGWPDLDIFQH